MEILLIWIVDVVLSVIGDKKINVDVLFDMSKVFKIINYGNLFNKLLNIGILLLVVDWFISYFFDGG